MVTLSLRHWLIAAALSLGLTISAEIGKYIQNNKEALSYKRRLIRHIIRD